MEGFRANVATVELAQGQNVFYCDKITTSEGDLPSAEEFSFFADRFKAMLLLKSADEKRFGDLKKN